MRTKEAKAVKKEILLLDYLDWPDHATPKDTAGVLGLLSLLDKFRYHVKGVEPDETRRILVHCRAGAGRTGTFLSILFAAKILKVTGRLDAVAVVRALRAQRPMSVAKRTLLLPGDGPRQPPREQGPRQLLSKADLATFKAKSSRILA